MIKVGEFNSIFSKEAGIPKIDAIRNSLKSISIEKLRNINQSIIKKAFRNKVLNNGTIDEYTVAAIDGTNLFNTQPPIYSNKRGRVYFSHSSVVMSLIGDGGNLVIDYELIKHKRLNCQIKCNT